MCLGLVTVLLFTAIALSDFPVVYGDDELTRGNGSDELALWYQFRGNLNNTGYSSSSVPETNDKFLSFSTLWQIYSSASFSDGIIYFGSQSNFIYAVDTATRTELWSYETGAIVDSTPLVNEDEVYVGSSDSSLYGLNSTTGDFLWSYPTGGEIVSSPKYHNGTIFFGSKDWSFYALDVSDRTHVWGAPFQTGGEIWGAPAIADDRVFFGSNDGNFYSIWIDDGTVDWTFDIGSVFNGSVRYSSAAVYEGKVIVGADDNNVYCLDEFTGEKIWNFTTGDFVYSSPAVHDGVVYVGSNDLNFYAIPLDDPNGDGIIDPSEVIWSVYTGDFEGGSSPAIADGKVLVGSTFFGLMCFNATDGSYFWNFTIPGGAVSSPTVVKGKVFIGGKNGVMYGLGSPDLGYSWEFGVEGDATPPTVVESSPIGSGNSIGSTISVTFSEAMDRASAEVAFSILPATSGNFTWLGAEMTYIPTSPLSYGTQHTVSIGTASKDLAGNNLASSHSWQFTTASGPDTVAPTVVDYAPNGTSIPIGTPIMLRFSEPMNRTSVEGAFSAVPAISGTFSWFGDTLNLDLTGPLWYSMPYTITVGTAAKDAAGNPLESPFSWQFTTTSTPDTTPPVVRSTTPTGDDVSTGTTITVTFSEPMDRDATEEAFTSSPDITGTFDWIGNTMIFTPSVPLSPGIQYTLTVRVGASDLAGNSLYSPSLEVEIIPESDAVKSNRVLGVSFLVTYDETPVEGAFVSLSISPTGMGDLSQLGASTFSDGTNRVKYSAPTVQQNTTVTITASASKSGFIEGESTYQIVVEPGTAYENLTAEAEFPWYKYYGYIGALVVLIVLNVAVVVLLLKRRKEEEMEETV
jgi:outer membrane protein assembly factor BamB